MPWTLCIRRVGGREAYRAGGRMYYSVESHIRYLGEAKAGEALYVTTQLLASMTSACMFSCGCTAGAMTYSSPRPNSCTCMSTRRARRRRRWIPAFEPSWRRFARVRRDSQGRQRRALDGPGNKIAMPKVVDHAQRRDEIAQAACQAVANTASSRPRWPESRGLPATPPGCWRIISSRSRKSFSPPCA